MNDDVYEVLNNYRSALQAVIEQNENLNERLNELSSRIESLNTTLFDEILGPAQDAMNNAAKESRYEDWSEKYSDTLGPVADQANAISGEGSDFMRDSFENYEGLPEPKPSEDEFVETLVNSTQEKIEQIREALGASKVELSVDEKGKEEIKADGEVVPEEVVQEAVEGEAGTDEAVKDVIQEAENEPGDEDAQIAEFEKELEKELKNYK